jgi:hypothetical protein
MGVLGLTLFALVVNYNIHLAIPPMTVQLQHPIDNTTNDSTGTGGRDCRPFSSALEEKSSSSSSESRALPRSACSFVAVIVLDIFR